MSELGETILPAPVLRSLKIKSSAVERLVKERKQYIDDTAHQRDFIEQLRKKDGVHQADINKQKEVLEETLNMVPFMERHIRKAMQDLENLVLSTRKDGVQYNVPELDNADKAIATAKEALPGSGISKTKV
ncbi:tubulin binding cofactor A [Coemansia reversa NRRL 1564]|uniref:Tubulin-specific chaperone A n=1 Tax=Coemansia reversa (strain ATCC 12441 / NRRL 1564) TaxID=763665 RepID=A0A2G5B576_COERN|nr:tubulin binding cofactor A [Coemansia reversa NRRL 1564]|eukprot:PIA14156.1 tubulin binding cofactor A [Coemansia reversa NRRL 1564]